MAQHYVIEPTRTASRWKQDYLEVLLETDSMEEAARVAEERKREASVDLFLRIRDETHPTGHRGLNTKELDEYFNLRRQVRKEKV